MYDQPVRDCHAISQLVLHPVCHITEIEVVGTHTCNSLGRVLCFVLAMVEVLGGGIHWGEYKINVRSNRERPCVPEFVKQTQ